MQSGLSLTRLCRLMRSAIDEAGLDLTDITVLTEAASGAYMVTPVIAAMANARHVHAVTRSTVYGSAVEITERTMRLASHAGVADRISITEEIPADILPEVDLVTNSGHLRPIDAAIIEQLPQRAVIALMFETWEFRAHDIDASACRRRGIPVVGVNERHPAVDVFSYLGPLAVKLLHDAGLPVYRSSIAVLCDNEFDHSIMQGLAGLGARVHCVANVRDLHADSWDAVLVALQPGTSPRVDVGEAAHLAAVAAPETLVAQFWGDVNREAVESVKLRMWPPVSPPRGHMAILLSSIGPEPIVRLQTGGLRAAEWVLRGGAQIPQGIAQPLDLESVRI